MQRSVTLSMVFLIVAVLNILSAQSQMYEICPLKEGQEIPNGEVMDQKGTPVQLKEVIQERATVIIFYRGAWCGYCTQHLAELNDIKDEVEKMGYQMIGITVDNHDKLKESTNISGNEIPVYSDSDLDIIHGFGLQWSLEPEQYNKYVNDYKLDLEEWSGLQHHALPVPAIYIIKDGVIVFQYVNPNYRVRLKPSTMLALLPTL